MRLPEHTRADAVRPPRGIIPGGHISLGETMYTSGQERVVRAILGPAHRVGARLEKRTVGGSARA